jgi:hypothetical protein
MALIARIIGLSLLTGGLGVGLGFAFFGKNPDWGGIALVLACVGAIVGALAGTARETVTALRQDLRFEKTVHRRRRGGSGEGWLS